MQLTPLLLATLATITPLLTTATATPSPFTAATTTPEAKKATPFRLKTCLHNPKKNKRHNNMYLGASQLNATSNEIYLTSTMPIYASHLNGTSVMFNLTNAFGETEWALENLQSVPYTGWQSTQINAGYANPSNSAFYLNATSGLLESSNTGFGGWRVCDWWHGDAQLFWIVKYYGVEAPGSCSDVDLVADYSPYMGFGQ